MGIETKTNIFIETFNFYSPLLYTRHSKDNMLRLILLFAICSGGSGTRKGNDVERDLECTTIHKGYSSGVQDRVYKAFSSTPTWSTFWTSHTSNSSPDRAAPLIDFAHNLVLAAFRGTFPTGGYGVEITKVRDTRDALVVHVKTRDPGPSSITTQAITQPFHMVRCERLGEAKPVEFVEEQWVPPPQSKYTFIVVFENNDDAADVLNKDVKALNFVISVQLLEAIKIGVVTVDAALVEGPDAAKALLEQVGGIKLVERDG